MTLYLLDNIFRVHNQAWPINFRFGVDNPSLGTIVTSNQLLLLKGWFELKGRMSTNKISVKNNNNIDFINLSEIRSDINSEFPTGFKTTVKFEGENFSLGINIMGEHSPLQEFKFVNLESYFSGEHLELIDQIQNSEELFSTVNNITCAAAKTFAGRHDFMNLQKSLIKFREDFGSQLQEFLIKIINISSKRFGLEFTAHGFTKTFRFWSIDEKTNYLKAASKATKILNEEGWPTYFSYGTILGLIRDGDLIEHDDDIDLTTIVKPELIAQYGTPIKALEEKLKAVGLNPRGEFKYHRHITIDGYTLDVFVAVENKDLITMCCHKLCDIPKESVYPLESRIFSSYKSTQIITPCKPIDFLEAYYGKTWQTPLLGFYF